MPTSALSVVPYTAADRETWNRIVAVAPTGTFLFDRGYMDYHADRFTDASVLVLADETPVAAFPANRVEAEIRSHGGLTYGGLLARPEIGTARLLDLLSAVLEHYHRVGATHLLYKAVPHFYHRIPGEADLYGLIRHGAQLVRRDLSSTVRLRPETAYPAKRRRGAARAERGGLQAVPSDDFDAFFTIVAARLVERHGVQPVHTADEMRLLASRFPDNIRLLAARGEAGMVAGVLTYETERVVHVQYMSTTDAGRRDRALDLLLREVVARCRNRVDWLDFGISTTEQGRVLNTGLLGQKEEYGASAVVYDTYRLEV